MPKVAKSGSDWQGLLKRVATGEHTLGRGQAPLADTDPGRLLEKIKTCHYFRKKRNCRVETKLFKSTCITCTCDFHKPASAKSKTSETDELEDANIKQASAQDPHQDTPTN